MILIGDLHGKISQYKELIKVAEGFNEKTITLGDNGFYSEWVIGEEFLSGLDGENRRHKWLGGNHDFYPNKDFKQSLGDFGIWENIFYVRGAKSIDRGHRVTGLDWFPDEELEYSRCMEAMDLYESIKPDYMISHTCPQSIKEKMFGFFDKDSTTVFLENLLLKIHRPKVWVFGHFHQNKVFHEDGTTFICLGELQQINLQI